MQLILKAEQPTAERYFEKVFLKPTEMKRYIYIYTCTHNTHTYIYYIYIILYIILLYNIYYIYKIYNIYTYMYIYIYTCTHIIK